jgi:hypothetical protein
MMKQSRKTKDINLPVVSDEKQLEATKKTQDGDG